MVVAEEEVRALVALDSSWPHGTCLALPFLSVLSQQDEKP
jgi:hypothetical protein